MSSNFEFKYNSYQESETVYGSLTLKDVYGRFSSEAGDRASFFDARQDKGSFAFDDQTDGPTKPSRSSNSILQQVMNYGRPPAVSRRLATLDDEGGLCDSISKLPNVHMSRSKESVQAPQDDVEALKAENLELREKLRSSTDRLSEIREENAEMRGKIQASAATIEELDRRLRETKAATGAGQADDVQRLADELASVKRQLVTAKSDYAVEVGKSQEKAQEIERVKILLGNQRTQIGNQNKEIRDKNGVIEELESANKSLLDRIRKLTAATPPAAAGGDDAEEELFEAGSESGESHEG